MKCKIHSPFVNFYPLSLIRLVFHLPYVFCSVVATLYLPAKTSPQPDISWTVYPLLESHCWSGMCKHWWYVCNFLSKTFIRLGCWLLNMRAIHAGKIVLQALVLTAAVVCSLTGYTFWAAKKGKDFSFLGPVLFASLIGLIFTGLLQVMLCLHCILQMTVFSFSFILF